MPLSQRKAVICTTRYLEQYIDEAVTLDTQQINNEDMAMDKDQSKVQQNRPRGPSKKRPGRSSAPRSWKLKARPTKLQARCKTRVGGLKDAVRGK